MNITLKTLRPTILLIGCILLSQSAGIIGSFFTIDAIQGWYMTLNRPGIAPPNWVFAPVWTSLYTMMGISFFLVIRKGISNTTVKIASAIFLLQLILNAAWSIVFFGNQNLQAAFLVIIMLIVLIVGNIFYFYKISRWAAYLLIPYLAWVSFASILNYQFWMLNR